MPLRKDDRKAQMPIPTMNKAVEVGVNLNNIFTALVLAGVIGIWTTLYAIYTKMGEVEKTIAVVINESNNMRRDFDEHRHNPDAHHRSIKR